jgi:hypothetical protein
MAERTNKRFEELSLGPARLGQILPGVLRNSRCRCERSSDSPAFESKRGDHGRRVRLAVRDFFAQKQSRPRKMQGQRKESLLWDKR